MEGITFETDRRSSSDSVQKAKSSNLIQWIVRSSGGRIDERAALRLLLVSVFIILLAAAVYPLFAGKSHYQDPPDAARHRAGFAPAH